MTLAQHSTLCAMAARWLKLPASKVGPGCNVALSECTGSYSGEIPDAIGFRSVGDEQFSVLVEVKVSRPDFLADARKPHRAGETLGMGVFRYYMAPAGLIDPCELPHGWGLVEVSGRSLSVKAGHILESRRKELGYRKDFSAWRHDRDAERETALLVRMLTRVGDAEALQRKLKDAHRRQEMALKQAQQASEGARDAFSRYWNLVAIFKDITGRYPPESPKEPSVSPKFAGFANTPTTSAKDATPDGSLSSTLSKPFALTRAPGSDRA